MRAVRAADRGARRVPRAGLFLAEGPQAVREARAAHARPALVRDLVRCTPRTPRPRYADDRWAPRVAAGLRRRTRSTAEVLAAMADTVTPQGLLGGLPARSTVPLDDVLDGRGRACWSRCSPTCATPATPAPCSARADAAGADAVVLTDASVDVYNPKVRAVHRRQPVPPAGRRPACPSTERCRAARAPALRCWPPTAPGPTWTTCDDERRRRGPWSAPRPGCSATRRGACRTTTRGAGRRGRAGADPRAAESLNLATAATVCLYASARATAPPAVARHRVARVRACMRRSGARG